MCLAHLLPARRRRASSRRSRRRRGARAPRRFASRRAAGWCGRRAGRCRSSPSRGPGRCGAGRRFRCSPRPGRAASPSSGRCRAGSRCRRARSAAAAGRGRRSRGRRGRRSCARSSTGPVLRTEALWARMFSVVMGISFRLRLPTIVAVTLVLCQLSAKEPVSCGEMAPRTAPSPVALAVLCLLEVGPLHPYGLQRLIKLWGKDQVINVGQRATLYKTIQRLHKAGLIAVAPDRARPGLPGAHGLRADRRGPPPGPGVAHRHALRAAQRVPRLPRRALVRHAARAGRAAAVLERRAAPLRESWSASTASSGASTRTCRG